MTPAGIELTIDQLLSALRWKVEQNDLSEGLRMSRSLSDSEQGEGVLRPFISQFLTPF